MVVFRVPIRPTGKARARVTRRGTFTPRNTKAAERAVIRAWESAGAPVIEGAVSATVVAVAARPRSHWRKNGQLSAAGLRSPVPMCKPDGDNVVKLIFDALNRRAYADDARIVHHVFERMWAPGVSGDPCILVSLAPWRPRAEA